MFNILISIPTGPYDMIEADVILKGQGTPKQALIPIISDLPAVDGDFTLKMWLQRVKKFTKGIKLDFRTIDAVEMSLQLLKGMKDEVRAMCTVFLTGFEIGILPVLSLACYPIWIDQNWKYHVLWGFG